MTIRCRLLAHAIGDGATNMALDEAILDEVALGEGTAYLRTYGWAEPTLSLGYFQRIADALREPRWADGPIVRRPTGGGALWHHHEITYAVVIPAEHPLSRPNTRLYHAVHEAVAGILRESGVAASRYGDEPDSARNRDRPFLCFTDRDAEDIIVRDCKVLGSAQRRRDGAILQHGSIVFARSPVVPEVRGVCDVAGIALDQCDWPSLVSSRLASSLGFATELAAVPESVQSRAGEYEQTRYRNAAWTRKR